MMSSPRSLEIRVDDEPLHDLEMVAMLAQMVFAGLDTTTNATASSLIALPAPRSARRVGPDPHDDRLWDSAIEELLRDTPARSRVSSAPPEPRPSVGGNTVKAGDRV